MQKQVVRNDWHSANELAIKERLGSIAAQTELAEIVISRLQGIFLRRHENALEMYCYDQETRKLSDIMSRIDVLDPLVLLGPYSQAMLLASCWRDSPLHSAYIAGFGGGRLAMLLHHCFPNLKIDGTDADEQILKLAASHFGIEYDQRYDIVADDSREDIAKRSNCYDLFMLDVFSGGGEHVNHLATSEFLALCRSKMKAGGIFAANLVEMDPLYREKINAIADTFKHCAAWSQNKAWIVFASDEVLDCEKLRANSERLEGDVRLSFPFSEHVAQIESLVLKPEFGIYTDGHLAGQSTSAKA